MGVTEFNKIIGQFHDADDSRKYNHVIIDCSNLITTFLMSASGGASVFTQEIIFDNYTVSTPGKLIYYDMLSYVDYLVRGVMTNIALFIKRIRDRTPSVSDIILVSDPVGDYNYEYIYDDDVQMSCVNNDMFQHYITVRKLDIDLDSDDPINIQFNSKEAEKQIRVETQRNQRLPPITITKHSDSSSIVITDYDDFKQEPDEPELKRIYRILYQYTYFTKIHNVMSLIPLIQQSILSYIEKYSTDECEIKYLLSQTEADIFIKAYYMKYCDPDLTLILSNDTDYNFLFGEFSNVDVGTISKGRIINPYQFWSDTLGTTNKRLIRLSLCRLSALFGNDYTCHKRKIVCNPDVTKYLSLLFNATKDTKLIDTDSTSIGLSPMTSLSKLIRQSITYCRTNESYIDKLKSKCTKYKDDPNELAVRLMTYKQAEMFNHIDAYAMQDDKFFIGYFETLLIYTNISHYDQYKDMLELKIDINDLKKKLFRNKVGYRINYRKLDVDECFTPIDWDHFGED